MIRSRGSNTDDDLQDSNPADPIVILQVLNVCDHDILAWLRSPVPKWMSHEANTPTVRIAVADQLQARCLAVQSHVYRRARFVLCTSYTPSAGMADETRGRTRTTPNQYSRLLEAKLGGHALWLPHERRGQLGDCGYIMDGIFWRLFNVYHDPPDGLPRLPLPSDQDISTSRIPNVSVFQSSHSSTVAFEASLPLAVPPANVSVSGRIASTDAGVAFLACSGGYHTMEFLSRVEVAKLRRYLCNNYPALQRLGEGDVFIVRSVMTASGWVGGVASRNRTDLSANASFAIPGLGDFSLGAVRSTSTGDLLGDAITYDKTAGPVEWTPEAPVSYPVVLGTLRLRKRDHIRRFLGLEATQTPTCTAAPSAPTAFQRLTSHSQGGAGMSASSSPAALTSTMLKSRELAYEREISSPSSSVSSDDVTLGPSSILDDILDDILAANAGLNAAVGDSALLADFVSTYGVEPTRGNSICGWERVPHENYGLVGYLVEICTLAAQMDVQLHQDHGHWHSRLMTPPRSQSPLREEIDELATGIDADSFPLGGANNLQQRVQRSACCDPRDRPPSPAPTRASRSRSSSAASLTSWGRPPTPVSSSRSSSRKRYPLAMDTDQNIPPISTPVTGTIAPKYSRDRGRGELLRESDVSSDGDHQHHENVEPSDASDCDMSVARTTHGGRDPARRDMIQQEMHRRSELRDAWRRLKNVLPASGQGEAKVMLLDRAAQHIAYLEESVEETNRRLEESLAVLNLEAERLRMMSQTLQDGASTDEAEPLNTCHR